MNSSDPQHRITPSAPTPADDQATRYTPPVDPDATGPARPNPAADPQATNYRPRQLDPDATGCSPTPTATQKSSGRRVLPCRFGDYELLEEIARGGMGVVYKARQQVGGRERLVALKMIQSGRLASDDAVERFLREAHAAAALDHPNIVPIFDIGEAEGQHYFTMQLLTGGSLADRLRDGPLPPDLGAQLVRQVAEGVQHAHQRGIIHRDLKPANILFAAAAPDSGSVENLIPRITDFGLARVHQSELSVTGAALGTPSFMPPEQARGDLRAVGAPSDVYGLGAVLYCALTGRPPFQSASVEQTIRQVCDAEPVPPRQLNGAVPRDLETVCLKCLAKEPQRRYGSAAEFSEELRRYERGEPVRARAVGTMQRVARWARRRPALAAVYVLLPAVLLLGLVGGTVARLWWLAETARQQADEARKGETAARQAEEVQRDRAEQALYVRQVALAQREWENAKVGPALELLEACPADRRGWEWRYLRRLCHGTPQTLLGHTDGVTAVAFSPDGTRIASASGLPSASGEVWVMGNGEVKVWDARTGQETLSFKGHQLTVFAVAFSPDGTRIASASWEKTVVWDARTGQEALSLQGHTEAVMAVAFSPDGTRIASASVDGTVKVWDVRTGQETLSLKGHTEAVFGVAFSPDGTRIASASGDQTVKVWNARTGQEVLSLKGQTNNVAGHTNNVTAVSFSPDGARLASAVGDQVVKVWDVRTGQETFTLKGHTSYVRAVAFSPDGARLASAGGDQVVRVWDARTGKEALSLKGHTGEVRAVAFSPDGARLASASQDKTVKVWDARIGQEAHSLKGHTQPVRAVAFSPDGTRIASAAGGREWFAADKAGEVKVWDARTGQEALSLKGLTRAVMAVAFSPDGTRLASASYDETVKVWDVRTGQETLSLKGHTEAVFGVAFSPDGTRIASASHDRTVKLWDARTGQEAFTLKGHSAEVTAVAFSPDGTRLASASGDHYGELVEVKLWDARTGQETLSLKRDTREIVKALASPGSTVTAVAFSPDGTRLASASYDQTVKVWDVRTGQEILSLKGPPGTRFVPAFTPDFTRIASGSRDNTVKVWDVRTGQEALSLKGHTSDVGAVAFSPDGARLAGAGGDQMVKVWDARTSQEPLTLKGHTERVASVAFSPDGKCVSAQDDHQAWKTWDTATGRELPPSPLPAADQRSAVSPDRRFRAVANGIVVQLVDTRLSPEQQEDLERLWRDDPAWHQEQVRAAEQAKDWFAAAFHLGRLIALRLADRTLPARRDQFRRLLDEQRRRFGDGPGRMDPVPVRP